MNHTGYRTCSVRVTFVGIDTPVMPVVWASLSLALRLTSSLSSNFSAVSFSKYRFASSAYLFERSSATST